MSRWPLARSCAALLSIATCLWLPPAMGESELLVFAAASLQEALDAAIAKYPRAAGETINVAYASSSTLARQIDHGAPADIFLSANSDWMDYLQERNLLRAATRVPFAGNSLVLIAPSDSTVQLEIAARFDLAAALGDGRLAMGDPDHVPAGMYGHEALVHYGVWESVRDSLARAGSTRAALALVARGEAPLGIVYLSDALADEDVRVVDTFPGGSHSRIVYWLAVTAAGRHPAAGSFADYLRSAGVRQILARHGFATRH
ncbi:MAG: molybdate ABC transporter substrate-binding protein [Gammaproteobacteria bacterium]